MAESHDDALKRATALHRAGKPAEAEAICRRLLEAGPEDARALHLLGLARDAAGAGEEAAALIGRAAERDRRNPTYRINLGLTLARLERRAEALAAFEEALKLAPGHVDALFNGAVVLQQAGRDADAEAWLRRALSVQPRHVPALNNLGNLLARDGRHREAAQVLGRAVEADGARFESRFNLARVLNRLGAHEAALPHARACAAARPDHPESRAELAAALTHTGDYEGGLAAYDAALALRPGYADALTNKGLALLEAGRRDEAVAAFATMLAQAPGHAGAHLNLSLAAPDGGEDGALAQIGRALDAGGLRCEDEMHLRFAAGNRLDAAGRHDEAFAAYARANALAEGGYDPAATEAEFAALARVFDAAFFAAHEGHGADSDLPVFVVGMPRSGTSLVEQILASHAQAFGAGERRTFNMVPLALPGFVGAGTPYPDCAAAMTEDHARRLAGQLLEEMRRLAPDAGRVVDKLPGNFMHLGLIRLLFPNATVIHCRRDPVDTCLSCFFTLFRGRLPFAYGLEDLAHYYGQYRRLMAHWRGTLPGRMVEVDYEALVAAPETEIPRMVEACGLPWDPACLRPHETERPVRTASLVQVRRPIHTGAVERWRRYEKHLGPLLRGLEGIAPVG